MNRDIAAYDYTNSSWTYNIYGNNLIARVEVNSDATPKLTLGELTYYLYDHLGNTRLTYKAETTHDEVAFDAFGVPYTLPVSDNRIVYAGDYYPYGKVLREFADGAIERYLTTHHDRDQETGLDYRGARYYDSDLGRFLSIDPWAAKYPSLSTYCYVAGNPIMLIDPSGKGIESTDVKKNADGTYTVVGGKIDGDRNIYLVDADGKRTGQIIGKSLTEYSFFEDNGQVVKGAIIDPKNQSGVTFLNKEIIGAQISLSYYMKNATGEKKYDFKKRGIKDRPKGMSRDVYLYNGMPFEGVENFGDQDPGVITFASGRDFGNVAAGYMAGRQGLVWETARLGFDLLQSLQKMESTIEGQTTQQAQRIGFDVGRILFLAARKQFLKEQQEMILQQSGEFIFTPKF